MKQSENMPQNGNVKKRKLRPVVVIPLGCLAMFLLPVLGFQLWFWYEHIGYPKVVWHSAAGEAVDLGLSVRWADRNVGASSPEHAGCYFAWGETRPKSVYKLAGVKNFSIDTICGNPKCDAASAHWGEGWRMPTKREVEELVTQCVWTEVRDSERSGYLVTGPNGNSIFLPAAGTRWGKTLHDKGLEGHYWTGTLEIETMGHCLDFKHASDERDGEYAFEEAHYKVGLDRRDGGLSIRPVTE